MAENKDTKIVGYKKMFGFVLPDWVDEKIIKTIALALFSIAVMLLVLILVIWPNMTLVDKRKIELKASKDALSLLRSSKEGVDWVQNELTSQEQITILSAIPQTYSPETAIYLLRKISNDTGVTIMSYGLPSGVLIDKKVAPIGRGGAIGEDMVGFSTFPIKITVAAPVVSLLDFVAKIETSLPFGIVSDLNLQEVTKLSKAVTSQAVQMSLEIMFYQSNLKSVNINKVNPFTPEDVNLAHELSKYNSVSGQEYLGGVTDSGVLPSNVSVFGF
jgi:hypothetical protein